MSKPPRVIPRSRAVSVHGGDRLKHLLRRERRLRAALKSCADLSRLTPRNDPKRSCATPTGRPGSGDHSKRSQHHAISAWAPRANSNILAKNGGGAGGGSPHRWL